MAIIFAACVLLVFYAYLGYPISLWLFARLRCRDVENGLIVPNVTIILTVYNEGRRIRQKIENIFSLEYPKDKLQVIVASDGSSDATNEIVREYAMSGIDLLDLPERKGKEAAQKEAVQHARGDVLVFTDVATMLDGAAIKEIVSNFADPTVGCVSSEDLLVDKDDKPAGEGLYVRYEMWLRRLESSVTSLVGLSGSFFAARKEVCKDFSGEMQSDFRTALNSVKLGLRGVSDPKAIGYYEDVADEKYEFGRKVRTVVRGLTVFFHHVEFLNCFKYGLFSYQYFCHKLLRWLAPAFLIMAIFSNMVLVVESPWWGLLLFLQITFYLLAVCGWWKGASWLGTVTKVPTYFVTVNASILIAWIRFLRGERIKMWEPSKR